MAMELKAELMTFLLEYELKRGEANVEDWAVNELERIFNDHNKGSKGD